MIDLSGRLKFYKRHDIQQSMLRLAKGKELAVKYADKGFGKRPDTIQYSAEIVEFIKQGVTSFHISEERWSDPLDLKPGLTAQQLNSLRVGWDLVIDIDSKEWEISKIATWLVVKTLQEFGIASVSVKFSGNKGFHVGVPFEAFEDTIANKDMSQEFPHFPKRIAQFIIDHIKDNYISIEGDYVLFDDVGRFSLDKLKNVTDPKIPLIRCKRCRTPITDREYAISIEFICPYCNTRYHTDLDKEYMHCERCGRMTQRFDNSQRKASLCSCGCDLADINPLSIIEVDTLLISSRHMYRCVYSLHEKSGLVSIPVRPEDILSFDKSKAEPHKVSISSDLSFLDSSKTAKGEAKDLILSMLEDHSKVIELQKEDLTQSVTKPYQIDFEELKHKAPEQIFPPCIHHILKGIADGKKRALFVLVNFLKNAGWNHEDISDLVFGWNKKNPEPMRENIIISHLRYHKNTKTLPPNCSNTDYYKDLGICHPDTLCKKIKNPVNYTRRKARALQQETSKKTKKKSGAKKKSPIPQDSSD